MKQIAFWCAVASLTVLASATVIGGAVYPGYSHLTQYISELGATGTTTGPAVSLALVTSGLLLVVFWGLCAAILPRGPLAWIGFLMLALNGLGLVFGGVFPCDTMCLRDDPSPSQMLHDLLGGLGYLFGIVGIFLVGIASRRWPEPRRLFRLSLICGIPAALAIWLIVPEFAWYGAAQRIVEIAFAIWTLAVALTVRGSTREKAA